jgi:GDPmannose 4,6-dehydratase
MLQQDKAEDFVIATGKQNSVREFITWAAAELGIMLEFNGKGTQEVGIVVSVDKDRAPAVRPGKVVVKVDPRYFRPTEVDTLLGDPSKAKQILGWVPEITAKEMCKEMVAFDVEEAKRLKLLKDHGLDKPVSLES